MASSPAYAKFPDHKVEVAKKPGRVRALFAGKAVADSTECRLVLESRHGPVVYFPRADVDMEMLEKVEDVTFCPFKGNASYYTIRADGREAPSSVWSYEKPYDEVAALKDCMAFYIDRIDGLEEG